MKRVTTAAAAVLFASCATAPTRGPTIEAAVRWGVDACERHLLDGMPLQDALTQSSNGRSFVVDKRNVEYWRLDTEPFRLDGLSVYVGADEPDEEKRDCRVIAVGAGSPALRDAIIEERLLRTDRKWTDATRNARGLRAACTTDRVPDGKSILMTAAVKSWWRVDTASIPNDPLFEAGVEMRASCEREADYWM